jgi:hypothetical protein
MRTRFIACGGCGRHVREGDGACPFCGAAAPVLPPVERVFSRGLSRAAMFAAGTAGVVVAMVDCGSGSVTSTPFYGAAGFVDTGAPPADATEEEGNTMTGVFYGVACPNCEAGADTSVPADSGTAADAQDAAGGDAAPEGGTDAGSGD